MPKYRMLLQARYFINVSKSAFKWPAVVTIGLPRVLDSKNYSSSFLLPEYSFNSTSGRKFQFPVPLFPNCSEELLEHYVGSLAFRQLVTLAI